MSRSKIKKTETSKKILRYCDILLALTVAATIISKYTGIDVSDLAQIVTALCGLSAAAHSFYYWKAKAENMRKYGRASAITMQDETDDENGGMG